MEDIKEQILNTLSDQITDFLYYDRREDEELQLGDIEIAIELGIISIEGMVFHFEKILREKL